MKENHRRLSNEEADAIEALLFRTHIIETIRTSHASPPDQIAFLMHVVVSLILLYRKENLTKMEVLDLILTRVKKNFDELFDNKELNQTRNTMLDSEGK